MNSAVSPRTYPTLLKHNISTISKKIEMGLAIYLSGRTFYSQLIEQNKNVPYIVIYPAK